MACLLIAEVRACDNPALHPDSEEFTTLLDSLSDQPRGVVQMMYKVGDARFNGWPIAVELRFWPISDYDDATVLVTPSADLELAGLEAPQQVPYKGSLDFTVKPTANGFHYLKIDVISRQGDVESTHTSAIAVSVGDHDEKHEQLSSSKAFGFAGKRLIEKLQQQP